MSPRFVILPRTVAYHPFDKPPHPIISRHPLHHNRQPRAHPSPRAATALTLASARQSRPRPPRAFVPPLKISAARSMASALCSESELLLCLCYEVRTAILLVYIFYVNGRYANEQTRFDSNPCDFRSRSKMYAEKN